MNFDSDYKGQYVTLWGKLVVILLWMIPRVSATVNGKGKNRYYSWKKQTPMKVLNSKFIIQVQMVIGLSSKLLGRSNTY